MKTKKIIIFSTTFVFLVCVALAFILNYTVSSAKFEAAFLSGIAASLLVAIAIETMNYIGSKASSVKLLTSSLVSIYATIKVSKKTINEFIKQNEVMFENTVDTLVLYGLNRVQGSYYSLFQIDTNMFFLSKNKKAVDDFLNYLQLTFTQNINAKTRDYHINWNQIEIKQIEKELAEAGARLPRSQKEKIFIQQFENEIQSIIGDYDKLLFEIDLVVRKISTKKMLEKWESDTKKINEVNDA